MTIRLDQVPNPTPKPPPGLDSLAQQLLGWLKWGVLIAGILGIPVCALMLIVGRRNRSATAYEGLVGSAGVIGLALASVAALLVGRSRYDRHASDPGTWSGRGVVDLGCQTQSAFQGIITDVAHGAADLVVSMTGCWTATSSIDPTDPAVVAAQGVTRPLIRVMEQAT